MKALATTGQPLTKAHLAAYRADELFIKLPSLNERGRRLFKVPNVLDRVKALANFCRISKGVNWSRRDKRPDLIITRTSNGWVANGIDLTCKQVEDMLVIGYLKVAAVSRDAHGVVQRLTVPVPLRELFTHYPNFAANALDLAMSSMPDLRMDRHHYAFHRFAITELGLDPKDHEALREWAASEEIADSDTLIDIFLNDVTEMEHLEAIYDIRKGSVRALKEVRDELIRDDEPKTLTLADLIAENLDD